ncbi:MAG TPA: PD-(D/E)XK nuclease family protein, partial [Burkholderiaceae bacterium]|nr:PD-(D/E)XK nuclease family protein [Burkholderiaceae bacterium]
MLHLPLSIKPCAAFWEEVARTLIKSELLMAGNGGQSPDLLSIRVVVPTLVHAQRLKAALASRMPRTFIPPRITTLSAWMALQPAFSPPASESARLMPLYAELRQHAWLKKLFSARRNTDLLPLAQMLLNLCDELTQALLPAIQLVPDAADTRWQAALEQLPPSARALLSDEAQLVWTIWKTQLDANDAYAARFAQMMRLAACADAPLAWVTPVEPTAFETAFLTAYGERQNVLPITLDWRPGAVEPAYAVAWRELSGMGDTGVPDSGVKIRTPQCLSLYEAKSLEDEAIQGAQTIIEWLGAGKSSIAIIPQDRVVARRIRALLERARIAVSDETGWKLSTTRAAAAIAAWLDVVAARAETRTLLDLLKSPFMFGDIAEKSTLVMAIEAALRSANVSGGWDAIDAALADLPAECALITRMAQQARRFAGGRKTLPEWIAATSATLDAMQMRTALDADEAGRQVIAVLDRLESDCRTLEHAFSFAEWRAFLDLELESAPFMVAAADKRVVMLPLNGAHLRSFDAVLLAGADADHLPSRPNETLFFANAVRHELGLATRESRQRQQLRDLTELLQTSHEVVVSWQAWKDGESNAVSPWIARLQLTLERAGAAGIPGHLIR